jgi:hypothetical protein
MTRLVRVLLIASLIAAAAPAGAFDFTFPWIDREASFEITETLVLDYHDDNLDYDKLGSSAYNDDYWDIRNRLNLKLTVEDFSFAARVDTTTFIDAPDDPGIKYLDRYAPEKLTASYHGKNLQVDLGDFYASFGRAIALRIRKTDELSEDTTLLGGKLRAQLGPVDLTALGGLSNPTNWDGITEKTLKDPYDLITGLAVAVRPMDSLVVRAHGVGLVIDPLDENRRAQGFIEGAILPEYAVVAGGAVEVLELADLADLYAEFNWMEKELKLPDLPASDGWAAYFGGNLYLSDVTLTAEFKSYSDYQLFSETDSESGKYKPERLHYIRPPTLEPEDMEVMNNHDVTGARLKVDWRPWDGDTLLFASYAGFVAQDPTFASQHSHHLIYLNAEVKVPLGVRHSLSAQGFNWWAHDLEPPAAFDYLRGEWTLAYSWSPLLTIGVILGYDTKFSRSRDLDIITDIGGNPVRQVFLAGSLTVNLSSRVVFNLLAGQMRGGPKCVSGACRVFPPFAGVRLETVIRL